MKERGRSVSWFKWYLSPAGWDWSCLITSSSGWKVKATSQSEETKRKTTYSVWVFKVGEVSSEPKNKTLVDWLSKGETHKYIIIHFICMNTTKGLLHVVTELFYSGRAWISALFLLNLPWRISHIHLGYYYKKKKGKENDIKRKETWTTIWQTFCQSQSKRINIFTGSWEGHRLSVSPATLGVRHCAVASCDSPQRKNWTIAKAI